jgi:hypothetical protein
MRSYLASAGSSAKITVHYTNKIGCKQHTKRNKVNRVGSLTTTGVIPEERHTHVVLCVARHVYRKGGNPTDM